MGQKKKVGKERLDKFYHLAKEQGYRARSAFKLIQLNKKYGFLQKSRVLVDLCAAPGGWLQVAAKNMPVSHLIIGVDLVPIQPIPNVITFACDITTEKCRSELKKELKTWKVDVFLNDGAPNVGGAWSKDAFTQSELVLSAFKLASEFLNEKGWFVTKIFRSKDYNNLLWVFNQLFEKVEATKPASSRAVSAEIFVVCKGFLAPKKIDPKFFDPKFVFEEMNEAVKPTDIMHPERHTRQRQGYEDGVTLLFKAVPAMDFIVSNDPATFLGSASAITFEKESANLLKFKGTSAEVIESCKDLRVLGKREFKILLKWRLAVRQELYPKEEKEQTEEEEENSEEELDRLTKQTEKDKRRDKRKRLEKKAKQRIRMELGMGEVNDAGLEQDEEGLFSLKTISGTVAASGEMIDDSEESETREEIEVSETESDYDIEQEMDEQYRDYRMKLERKDPYLVVQTKRNEELPFTGVTDLTDSEHSDSGLVVDLEAGEKNAATMDKASVWFSNPVFRDLEDSESEEQEDEPEDNKKEKSGKRQKDFGSNEKPKKKKDSRTKDDKVESTSFELVTRSEPLEEFTEEDKLKLLNPGAMSLAVKAVTRKTRDDLIDDSFNRYAFADRDELPSWFKDEELKHNKPQVPITKEGVALLKAKLKTINVKVNKKELEAKGRKKMRASKKLAILKQKASVMAESEEMTEMEKSKQINKLLNKKVTQKKPVKLVVGKGANRGQKGRPKGVKGKYKMVDRRMVKDLKAKKRVEKRNKK